MLASAVSSAIVRTSDQLCDAACQLERDGRHDAALSLYQQAVSQDAGHYRSLLLGSNLLTMLGRRREATQWAERALARDDNEFSRALLVEALVVEAMESAAEGNARQDRLLWIGTRLRLLGEGERAQAVLGFVRDQGGEDLAAVAALLESHLVSPAELTALEQIRLRERTTVPPATLQRIAQFLQVALRSVSGFGEAVFLRVPCEGGERAEAVVNGNQWVLFNTNGTAPAGFDHPVARALALASDGDTLGAGAELYGYLKSDEDHDFGVYAPAESMPVFGVALRFALMDFTPDSARRHLSRQAAIEALWTCYQQGEKSATAKRIIEALALGLCRWHGLKGRYQAAIDVVQEALQWAPFAMHLKTARAVAGSRLQGEEIHPRLEKFVGEDSGYLKRFVCEEPFTRVDIDQNGGARVCCGHWMPTQLGSVMQHDPLTLLNSPIGRKIKRSVMEGDYRYCNHLDCMQMVQGNLPTREVLGADKLALWAKDDYTSENVEHLLFAFDQSCNLSCPSCRTEKIVEKASLSQQKMEVIETKLAPMLKGLKQLDINPAGELFASKLARRLLTLVDPKENPELNIDIISNGTLFNEENWNALSNIHELVGYVRVSVDGCTKPTFERLRRLAVWEPFLENMKFLRELRRAGRIQSLRYSFTYQRDNFREMAQFVDFAREMGCDFVIFEKLQNMGAYSVAEYHARAVHLPDHALHGEYLDMVSRELFYQPGIARDFDRPMAVAPA